jgi:hypothetical protein
VDAPGTSFHLVRGMGCSFCWVTATQMVCWVAFTMRTVWRPAVCDGLVAAGVTAGLCEALADGLPVLGALLCETGAADESAAAAEAVAVAETIGAAPALVPWSAPPEHPTSAVTRTPLTTVAANRPRAGPRRRTEPATQPTIPNSSRPRGASRHHSPRESPHPPPNNRNPSPAFRGVVRGRHL